MLTRTIKVTNLTGLVKELQFRQPGNPIIAKEKLRNSLYIWTLGTDIRDFLAQDDSPTVCMDHEIEDGKVIAAAFAGSAITLTLTEA
jgi:hypothetical protein